jgi:predicted PurR-regulated permease PerM
LAASPSSTAWQRSLIVCGSLVLVVAALYWARAVLIPVVLAVLLTFILSPLVSALQRRGLGRIPSVVLVVALAFSLLGAVCLVVVLEVMNLATDLPKYKENIVNKIVSLQQPSRGSWLDQLTNSLREITQQVEDTQKATTGATDQEPVPVRVESSPWAFVQSAASPTLEALAEAGLAAVLVVFMLIQREDLRNRLIRLRGNGSLTGMTKALDDAGQRISRFLLMQLVVNATYGAALAMGLFLIGVPYPVLWGFLAAVLRYIPYLGPWLAALFPITLSVVILPGWTQPLLTVGFFIVLELVSNNVMEPWLYGRSIGVSEVALLIAAAFWTWLWGPIGLVLSTPLTACLAVLGRYVPHLEFFSVLLGDEPALETHVTYYQRLLAKDQDEATDLVEEYLKTHPAEEVYDRVLLPALALAKENEGRGELTPADEEFTFQVTSEVLGDLALARQQARRDAAEQAPERVADEPSPGQQVLVFGCPAKEGPDELALHLLRQLLDPARCRLEVVPGKTLSGELLSRVQEEQPVVVCIAVLPGEGLAHTRYLCKRLRAQFPDLKILVGCWGLKDNVERITDRLRSAGADQVGTTLLETRDQLVPLVQLQAHAQEPKADRPLAAKG